MNDDALENFKKARRSDCLTFENFDSKYGINTSGPIRLAKNGCGEYVPDILDNRERYPISNGFQNTALPQIDMINNYLRTICEISKYNFIDFGSGKGKILFYNQIVNTGYKSLIGIEIDKDLYNISIDNSKIIPGPFFYNMDATKFELEDNPTILFCFRPFSEKIWDEYLSRLDFKNEMIIVSLCGFGEIDPTTSKLLKEPELEHGFIKIHEEDLVYFYKKV